jgi:serine/threonine protein kinase
MPTQIGPYTITREIGRNGMGVVYLARDSKLDRDVAIKALPPELAEDADRLTRFRDAVSRTARELVAASRDECR